jgi:hypothetical protein
MSEPFVGKGENGRKASGEERGRKEIRKRELPLSKNGVSGARAALPG